MQELLSSEFDRVRPIYDKIEDSRAIVFSVIEGNTPGRIFVDRTDHPATAVLRFSGGEIYLGGRADDESLNREIVALLFTELAPPRSKLLVFSFSEAWKLALDELLANHGVRRVVRETFELSPELFGERHTGWRSRLPEEFRLERMDRRLALESDSGLDFLWGGIDNFIARAFGYCVLKDGHVVSRCSPVALGDRRFETGIGTVEPYRRRGLATAAACGFIEHCLEEGLCARVGLLLQCSIQITGAQAGLCEQTRRRGPLCGASRIMRSAGKERNMASVSQSSVEPQRVLLEHVPKVHFYEGGARCPEDHLLRLGDARHRRVPGRGGLWLSPRGADYPQMQGLLHLLLHARRHGRRVLPLLGPGLADG